MNINILKGVLNRKEMARFVGVKPRDVDIALAKLVSLGYFKYRKIKGGKYKFTLFPEPITELELRNN